MRFTISREKLQEGLAAVTAAVPAKTTLPVLSNLLVETTERGIRFSATDLDIAVSTEVSAAISRQGFCQRRTARHHRMRTIQVQAPWTAAR
jgi:DNA polymerase-3 subunit beta